VPAYAVVKGSPAKVVHDRRELEAKVRAAAGAAGAADAAGAAGAAGAREAAE
jgi:hypothetical protein